MRNRRLLHLGIVPLVFLAASCATVYEPLPPAPDFKAAALVGEWRGPEGARLTLSDKGEMTATRLRGQEMDFDDHWSLSGKGSWQVLPSRKGGLTVAEGQMVKIAIRNGKSLTAKVGKEELDGSGAAPAERKNNPTTYTWEMSVKEKGKGLILYYVVGDPDVQWLCEFTHS
jgi:hypothetical protein